MNRQTCLSLLAFFTLAGAVQAKPIDSFPVDPAGAIIQDRLFERLEIGDEHFDLYAVLYSKGGAKRYVDIYRGVLAFEGMDWKKLHTWNVPQGPDEVQVLSASLYEDNIAFTVLSWFKYVEGRAVPVLQYDPTTGKFEATLED